jgi:hypothetical protein
MIMKWLPLLLIFIPFILIVIWTAQDAKSRGLPGYLVGLLVALSGLTGMILWLLVRPKKLRPYQTNPDAVVDETRRKQE